MNAQVAVDPNTGRGRFSAVLRGIVGFALVLRIATVLWIPTQPVSDFWSYRSCALTVANSGHYPVWGATLAPGYPLWLFVLDKILGPSVLAARLSNCLLSATLIALAGLLARELFGTAAGLIAASLLALDPRQILQTGLLASENLSGPITFAFLLLTARSWRKSNRSQLAAMAGLLLGFASLARPATRPLFLLWPLTGVIAGGRLRAALKETVILLAIVFAVLLPWGIWNLRHNHRWVFSTTTVGSNLFEGNHAGASGEWHAEWPETLRAIRPDLASAHAAELDRAAGEVARAWIRAHPLGALHLYVRKLGLYLWRSDPTSVAEWAIFGRSYWPPNPPADVISGAHVLLRHRIAVSQILRGWYRFLLLAGAVALVALLIQTIRLRRPATTSGFVLIVGACASFPILTCAFSVVDRFRWPFEDLLCVLAAGLAASLVASADLKPSPSA